MYFTLYANQAHDQYSDHVLNSCVIIWQPLATDVLKREEEEEEEWGKMSLFPSFFFCESPLSMSILQTV